MSSATEGSAPVKVLYIMGRGRSGSTIFANALGELDGFFSAGEVRDLWGVLHRGEGRCGCGHDLSSCAIWSQVVTRLSDVDRQRAAGWQQEIVRERNLLRLLRSKSAATSGWQALQHYAGVMKRVYAELAESTGAAVIVDSSKRPSYAAFVRLLEGIDPYFVEFVRDPRASSYSWHHRRHQSVLGGDQEVKRRNAFDSTLRWDLLNLEARAILSRSGTKAMRLRYEDFTTEPRATVEKVAAFVGEHPKGSPFVDEHTIELGTNHTLSGNPSRFATGLIEIGESEEWRSKQTALQRATTTLVALPLLRSYGYPLRPPRN